MKRILITYDLRNPRRDYSKLYAAIKAFPSGYVHVVESVWIVYTSYSAGDVRDDLKSHLDSDDELFCVDISGQESAWWHLPTLKAWLDAHPAG